MNEQHVIDDIEIADTVPVEATPTRRTLMSKGLMAAAVGAAAGVALSDRTSAANGDFMNVGNSDTGSSTTSLSGGTTFRVSGGDSSGDASIYGIATDSGGDYGVRGDASGSQSVAGVYGASNSQDAPGVYGAHTSTTTSGPGVVGESASSDGVYGKNTDPLGGYGVHGEATSTQSGIGVYGEAAGTGSTGVYGEVNGSSSSGVQGRSTARASTAVVGRHVAATGNDPGTGVLGVSDSGVGVNARGSTADITATGTGVVRLVSAATPAPTPTTSGVQGSIARDDDGSLWYCYETDKWRKLAGASTGGSFHPVTPFRAYDSRPVAGGPGPLAGGTSRVVSIKDSKNSDGTVLLADSVPAGATAITFNLTLVATAGRGFLSVADGEATESGASTINWSAAGVNLANGSTVVISDAREVKVFCGPEGSTNFILDVTGYYL